MKNNNFFDKKVTELGLSSKDQKILLSFNIYDVNDLTRLSIYDYFFFQKKTGINAKKIIDKIGSFGIEFACLDDSTMLESLCCGNIDMEKRLASKGLSYITVNDFCNYPTHVLKTDLGTTYYRLRSELHTNGYLLNGEQKEFELLKDKLLTSGRLELDDIINYLPYDSHKIIDKLGIDEKGLTFSDITSLDKNEFYDSNIPKYISDDMLFLIHNVGLKTCDEIKGRSYIKLK